jgi:hypothetical protein
VQTVTVSSGRQGLRVYGPKGLSQVPPFIANPRKTGDGDLCARGRRPRFYDSAGRVRCYCAIPASVWGDFVRANLSRTTSKTTAVNADGSLGSPRRQITETECWTIASALRNLPHNILQIRPTSQERRKCSTVVWMMLVSGR